jgi:thioredoxin reductase (NADPH)
VHHRDVFRAAPDSVSKMQDFVSQGKMDLVIGKLNALHGNAPDFSYIEIETKEGIQNIKADCLLAFYGLTMKLGPIANFGLNLHENLIPVETEKFETTISGIFAIGDINYYPGKLKLILSGFHEAALMAKAAFAYVYPNKKFRFQYTTSSSNLQQKLGVN